VLSNFSAEAEQQRLIDEERRRMEQEAAAAKAKLQKETLSYNQQQTVDKKYHKKNVSEIDSLLNQRVCLRQSHRHTLYISSIANLSPFSPPFL